MNRSSSERPAGTAAHALDIAERLLQVKGYNGFAYADIAAELGITRAALHYHFPGKSELGDALIDRYADRFLAALRGFDNSAPDAAAKLAGYVELYTEVLRRHRMCLCGMLAAEYQTLPVGMQERVSSFFDSNAAWLEDVLDQGRREGSLTVTGSVHDVAAMLLGGLEGLLLIRRIDGDIEHFRAAAHQLVTQLVGPLAAAPSGA